MTAPNTLCDDDSLTSTDTSDTDNAAIELAAKWNGPRCEKCEAPMKSDAVSVCRRCGWYARLNQFVDVDQDWEVYDDEAEQKTVAATPSHIAVWLNLLPPWAWIVIATVAAVVAESVVARLVTPHGSALRTAWSLTQLVVGLLAFASCHLVTFLFAVADDADTGVLDIILKPLKLWMKQFAKLPARLWLTDTAAAGLTAAVMSVVVIGGLPYERLWDWGFKEPPKQNLMGAMMSQVQKAKGQGADNLEDAVKDFAGTQNLDENGGLPAPPPKPRLKADCVILGYRLDARGRLSTLILATSYRRQLVFAGAVTPRLSEEDESGLIATFAANQSDQPFLPVEATATWLKPKFACRVSYAKRSENGRLLDPQWEELTGGIRLE
jgi:putative Ca2+/H+ antiporter (TMEM165/GDT1 family)